MYTSGADLGGGWRGSRTPSPLKMTCGFLIQLVFWQKKLLVYWCWSKTRDEVGEFMLNALKMVVCLNSAVSFNMYSQQFTLCWCEVYEIILTFTLCYCLVKSLQKPSSWYSLLKFVYVTSQLHHSLVMQPLLWKILDPPLHLLPAYSSITLNTSLNNLIPWFRLWLDTPAVFECLHWYQFRQYVLFQRAEFDAFLYSYARQVLVSKNESYTDWVYVSWSRSISVLNFLGWLFEQSLVCFYFF